MRFEPGPARFEVQTATSWARTAMTEDCETTTGIVNKCNSVKIVRVDTDYVCRTSTEGFTNYDLRSFKYQSKQNKQWQLEVKTSKCICNCQTLSYRISSIQTPKTEKWQATITWLTYKLTTSTEESALHQILENKTSLMTWAFFLA